MPLEYQRRDLVVLYFVDGLTVTDIHVESVPLQPAEGLADGAPV